MRGESKNWTVRSWVDYNWCLASNFQGSLSRRKKEELFLCGLQKDRRGRDIIWQTQHSILILACLLKAKALLLSFKVHPSYIGNMIYWLWGAFFLLKLESKLPALLWTVFYLLLLLSVSSSPSLSWSWKESLNCLWHGTEPRWSYVNGKHGG